MAQLTCKHWENENFQTFHRSKNFQFFFWCNKVHTAFSLLRKTIISRNSQCQYEWLFFQLKNKEMNPYEAVMFSLSHVVCTSLHLENKVDRPLRLKKQSWRGLDRASMSSTFFGSVFCCCCCFFFPCCFLDFHNLSANVAHRVIC